MAIKTFTTGEVLTASDTNTYLANSGLVYLSTTTWTATATKQFTNTFSSTYRNYRAYVTLTASAGANFYLRLLVGTTVQAGNILSIQWGTQLSVGTLAVTTRADQYALNGAAFATYPSTYVIDFMAPQAADYTNWTVDGVGGRSNTDSDSYHVQCRNIATTQIDGFEFTTAAATTLAGTMTLYGVRNA